MTDARNVAHDKKVMEEKKHEGVDIAENTENVPQPGKKPALEKTDDGQNENSDESQVSLG